MNLMNLCNLNFKRQLVFQYFTFTEAFLILKINSKNTNNDVKNAEEQIKWLFSDNLAIMVHIFP